MLNPVATQTLIPIEEYLRTVYEPDAEFVDGEIVERSLGEDPHSAVQVRLVEIFYELRKKHRVSGYPLYSSGEPSYPWTRAVGGEDRGN